MLPAETFADVVSFLGYYDHGGLKLANKLLFAVANQCADAIRLFDFTNFTFCIGSYYNDDDDVTYKIRVDRLDFDDGSDCTLELGSEEDMAEFISEAFRNCTMGRLMLMTTSELVLNAVKVVANTVIVANLDVSDKLEDNVQVLIEFVDSFPRVENLVVSEWEKTLDTRLKDFCQRKKIGLDYERWGRSSCCLVH